MKTIKFEFEEREGDINAKHWLAEYILKKAMSERNNAIRKAEDEAFNEIYEKVETKEIFDDDEKLEKFDKLFKSKLNRYSKNKRYVFIDKNDIGFKDIKDNKTGIVVEFSDAKQIKNIKEWGTLFSGKIKIPKSVKWEYQDLQIYTWDSKNNFEKALLKNNIKYSVKKLDNEYDTHIFSYKIEDDPKTAIISTYAGFDDVIVRKHIFKGKPPQEYIDYLVENN